MGLTISDVLSLMIIGILWPVRLAGMVLTRKKEGLGKFENFGLGLVGALLGGLIVRLFKIDFGLGQIVLRWEDFVAAFIGCFVIVVGRKIYKKKKESADL